MISRAQCSASGSLAELVDLSADAGEAAAEGHVHELGLGVHLESPLN